MNQLLRQCTVDGELTPELLARAAELEQEMEAELSSIKGNQPVYVDGQWLSAESTVAKIRQNYSDLWQQELTDAGYMVRPIFESIKNPSFEDWYEELNRIN